MAGLATHDKKDSGRVIIVPDDLDAILARLDVMQINLEALHANRDAVSWVMGTYDAYLDKLYDRDKEEYQRRINWQFGYNKRRTNT